MTAVTFSKWVTAERGTDFYVGSVKFGSVEKRSTSNEDGEYIEANFLTGDKGFYLPSDRKLRKFTPEDEEALMTMAKEFVEKRWHDFWDDMTRFKGDTQ